MGESDVYPSHVHAARIPQQRLAQSRKGRNFAEADWKTGR